MQMNSSSNNKNLEVSIFIKADNPVDFGIALSIMGAAKAHLDAMAATQKMAEPKSNIVPATF